MPGAWHIARSHADCTAAVRSDWPHHTAVMGSPESVAMQAPRMQVVRTIFVGLPIDRPRVQRCGSSPHDKPSISRLLEKVWPSSWQC